MCGLKPHLLFFLKKLFSGFQEMYKASKYEVSPDLKYVLLAYNAAPVSFSITGRAFHMSREWREWVWNRGRREAAE